MIVTFPKRNAVDLFRDWVPKWMEPVVALIILLPVLVINGAYCMPHPVCWWLLIPPAFFD